MRRMISEEKANLLNKQAIDSNGVIVDENDREFNGDINFTGTVTGIDGGNLYYHAVSEENGYSFTIVTKDATPYRGNAVDLSKKIVSVLVANIGAIGATTSVMYNPTTKKIIQVTSNESAELSVANLYGVNDSVTQLQ